MTKGFFRVAIRNSAYIYDIDGLNSGAQFYCARSTGTDSGRVGSGRVGSGRVGSGRVGSGRVGSGRSVVLAVLCSIFVCLFALLDMCLFDILFDDPLNESF